MGKALSTGDRRDKVFLMTKPCGRTEKETTAQFEDSLRRLKIDRTDLRMFHGIPRMADHEWIFHQDGAIQGALKPRETAKSATSDSADTKGPSTI